jgi:hypothetical protein
MKKLPLDKDEVVLPKGGVKLPFINQLMFKEMSGNLYSLLF